LCDDTSHLNIINSTDCPPLVSVTVPFHRDPLESLKNIIAVHIKNVALDAAIRGRDYLDDVHGNMGEEFVLSAAKEHS